jgi:hypothetical protein
MVFGGFGGIRSGVPGRAKTTQTLLAINLKHSHYLSFDDDEPNPGKFLGIATRSHRCRNPSFVASPECTLTDLISTVPPEMFAAIFSFLCLPGIPSLGGTPDRNLARLRVTHVCRQWREIALNQPQLWSHVNFDTLSMAGAGEILVRAKSVPLYMARTSSKRCGDRFGQFLKEVQARIPHIRHLTLGADDYKFRLGLKDDLDLPAPTLEYLSLFCQWGNKDRNTVAELPFISDTLFSGSTPRLSCLVLRNCNISWNSPLLKGLTSLKILTPFANLGPKLAVWLDALDKIPQLRTLTLQSASPVAPFIPFNVERTAILPSLTHLSISASLEDCALAIAHLVLPALTSLCLTAINRLRNSSDVQRILPYIARHAHGPQDIQPLQSILIRNDDRRLQLLAWPVPDVDTLVDDPPVFLGATLRARVKLSFRSKGDARLEIFDTVMAALLLEGLVMLVAEDLDVSDRHPRHSRDPIMQQFWLSLLPDWPLLRRVRLGPITLRGFIKALLEDNRGCENPLLPSLTEVALVDTSLDANWTVFLCDALMKRVDQGVPLETLDLRMCYVIIL